LTKEEAKKGSQGQTIIVNINGNSAQAGRELLELLEQAVGEQTFGRGGAFGIQGA
jgi:hypothetical protein